MNELEQQVARARRRLVTEQFLTRAVWCLFAALVVAAVAIAVPRVVALENLPDIWDLAWLVAAVGFGLLAATAWTMFSHRTSLDAAIEIDRRFDLRERVASSLSLTEAELASEAGQALVKDALRAARRIDVDDMFRLRLSDRAWLPLVPAAIAFALVLFVHPREAASSIDRQAAQAFLEQKKTALESARKKLEEQRKQAERNGLKAAEGLFKQIEEGTRDLSEKRDIDRTNATVKLNDLARQLEERQKQLGGKEGLQKQFQNLKNLGAGPGDKIAQAMKQGDFKMALAEIEKLAKDLREGKLDEKAKAELAQQLAQMKEKLQAAAEAHQQVMDDLKKQIDQLRKQGDLARAGELQQKLDQLQQQAPQMNRLQQLANQLGQAQQGLQQGDGQKAAAALGEMADQLDQLQQEMNELAMLDAAMQQLAMAKDAMGCQACQGEGCQACQGGQFAMDELMNQRPGMGIGKGRGIGPRPNEPNNTNTRDTQVRQKPGQGAATFGGLVEGPNIRGDVEQAIQQEMASQAAEPADPITSDQLPRNRREHAEQYFQILREGS